MEKDKSDYVTIQVVSELDRSNLQKDAEENAWLHAKESALVNNIDLGDDEFQAMYTVLSERYNHNIEHLNFFMVTALLTLRSMLETEYIKIVPDEPDEGLTEEEIADKLRILSERLVNSYLWITAGYELTWLHNDDLPDEIVVSYKFDPNDLQ